MINRIFLTFTQLIFNFLSFLFQLFVRTVYPSPPSLKPPTRKSLYITLDFKKPMMKISDRYLSFAIDTSYILGGHRWNSSGSLEFKSGRKTTTPLNLGQEKLQTLALALSPAYLRVGGTEADNVLFDNICGEKFQLNLTKQIWDNINIFAQKANLDLFFTVNAGPLVRQLHRWQSKNLENLLNYSKEKKYKISVFELGNELNAFWYFHGFFNIVTSEQYINDFKKFKAVIKKYYPHTKVAGPSTIYWPRIGEAFSFVGNIASKFIKNTEKGLNIFTWHYYPQQSERCPITFPKAKHGLLLNPQNLDDIGKWAKELNLFKERYNTQSEVWLGEIGNALCGGQPGISDTFESSLWWTDVLGFMATMKQSVIVRQNLIGSTYSLLDKTTLTPLPDFWASLLWKRLMGTKVFQVQRSDDNPYVRIYAHSTNNILRYDSNAVTIVFINLENKKNSVDLKNINTDGAVIYQLTAKKLNDKSILLNNKPLVFMENTIPVIEGEFIKIKSSKVELSSLSITYFVFPHAGEK